MTTHRQPGKSAEHEISSLTLVARMKKLTMTGANVTMLAIGAIRKINTDLAL